MARGAGVAKRDIGFAGLEDAIMHRASAPPQLPRSTWRTIAAGKLLAEIS